MSFTCKEPKLRFPEFRGEWVEKKLGELTSYVDYRGKSPQKVENGIFLVTAKNIKKGYIDYESSKEYVLEKDYNEIMKRGYPHIGDVLLTTEAPLGNVAQIDNENIALAQRVIKFSGNAFLDNTFLKHYFLSDKFQELLASKAIGTTVLGIQGKVLHKLLLNIPLKPEQEKIASFLSVVDAKIEQLTCKDKLLQKYKKSAMQKLFSQELRFTCNDGSEYPEWEEKKLGEIGKFNAGGDLDKLDYSKEKNEKYLYPIYANGAGEGLYGYATTFQYKKNCVTVSGRGSLGYANVRNQKFNAIVRLIVIEPKENINSKFLEETINKINFAIESTGVPQLTVPQISSYKINIPSLEEQTKIANFLSAIDEKCLHVKHQLEQTRQFKKALLQQMFV